MQRTDQNQRQAHRFFDEEGNYVPPTHDIRNAATGIDEISNPRTKELLTSDERHFTELSGEWIARFQQRRKDAPQSYSEWRQNFRYRFDPSIHTIYLMYLDAGLNTLVTQYAIPREHLLEPLKEYVTAFFGGVKVEILGNYCEIVSKKEGSVTLSVLKKTFELRTRVLNGQTQIMSADAYEVLNFVKTTLPNAFCVAGILETGLCPDDGAKNPVYGETDDKRRLTLTGYGYFVKPNNTERDSLIAGIVYQLCAISTHELGHAFGISHCLYGMCCMNASRHPLYMCPVELRKIAAATGCDLEQRYRSLFQFMKGRAGFETPFEWLQARMTDLRISETIKFSQPTVPRENADQALRVSLRVSGVARESVVVIPRRDLACLLTAARRKLNVRSGTLLMTYSGKDVTDSSLLSFKDGVVIDVLKVK